MPKEEGELWVSWLIYFQIPRIDLRKLGSRRMLPTIAMRDLMAASFVDDLVGPSVFADKIIGCKINDTKRCRPACRAAKHQQVLLPTETLQVFKIIYEELLDLAGERLVIFSRREMIVVQYPFVWLITLGGFCR